ncbi:hypothetical protein BaRGS_00023005 [Batillaria attramentaria]|uniref:Uncharacterized protein n=1 Tax=Batillaria attramentaria TaxID=370345 RepID=A0ABD0KEX5_9CAEN
MQLLVFFTVLDRLEGELTPAGDGNVENVTVQDEDDVGNFSMPDLAGNFSIPYGMPFGECYHVLPQPCYDEAASKNELGMDKLSSYTLEQIVPRAQNFVRDLVECAIDYHKAREDTCPNWRGIALLTIARDVVPSILGTSFPFTKEQMIDMLEDVNGHDIRLCERSAPRQDDFDVISGI